MKGRLKGILVVTSAVAALGVGGAAIAAATGGDDGSGKPITGGALDKASAVALDHTNGGRVTDTEVGDEEGYYEVEVTRDNGSQVDVHLDRHFKVLADHPDQDSAEGSGPSDR